jgi:hypothetical protein
MSSGQLVVEKTEEEKTVALATGVGVEGSMREKESEIFEGRVKPPALSEHQLLLNEEKGDPCQELVRKHWFAKSCG